MTSSGKVDPGPDSGKPDARAERLKAALRENLRRRKAQGRGRTEGATPRDPRGDGSADA